MRNIVPILGTTKETALQTRSIKKINYEELLNNEFHSLDETRSSSKYKTLQN